MSIRIKLPDGSVREFEEEASIEDVAASISCGLEHAVAGKLNGKLVDLSTPLQDGALVEIVTRDSAEGQKIVREKSRGKGRIVALDAARGLAVIGMYLQHFALNETNGSIVSGNTTLLFVLCGGISYSIMAGRMSRGMEPAAFRTRMLARAVFIDMIGYLLIMLNTPFGVILPAYAALFVLALALIRRSTRVLVTTAAVLLAVSPPLMILGGSVLSGANLLGDIAGGPMSALALAPAFVAGMAIGRFDLTRMRTALSLVSSGAVMLIVSKLLGVFVLPWLSRSFEEWLVSVQGTAGAEPDQYAIWPHNVAPPLWHNLLSIAPHSASTFQTMLGLGVAFLVLGLVCLVQQKNSAVLKPFAGVGRVALTMYAAQFVVIWTLEISGAKYDIGAIPFSDLFVAAMVTVTGWLIARLPTGPLETAMRRFDRAFSNLGPVTGPARLR
ncbi:TGS domain-containing protein [Bacillus licheniformis]|uniref:TGS domain-containing protein n=1 Tax=Bacillus licheniformis TaxID=1402 RepID=UPI0011A5A04A|nr:TGS domain-containing protein [Bacillus licheniformis]MCM3208619.1 TGS domain-containing protein [Bacillus licheniformis]MCM3284227.1 TGS domain-containing protein [Bacillus licheniformis]TWK00882.1 Threonine--tRNA ligase 1 [Bacillus licheniformis]